MSEEYDSVDLSGPVSLDMGSISDELIPLGWHTVTIERVDAKLTREKKLPSLFVMARISEEGDPDHKRTIIWNLMLAGSGLIFTKRCFKALGLPDQLEFSSYEELAAELIGLECEVEVKHREYQGEQQVQVGRWRPAQSISF